jgi:hypothetical protein
MTRASTDDISGARRPRWLIAKLAVAAALALTATTAAYGAELRKLQLLKPAVLHLPTTRTVQIQGGGLMFLDAHEIAEKDYDVVIRQHQNNSTQKWILTDVGGGLYTIMQQSSGRYLDAHEIEQSDYRVVTRPRQTFDQTQLWRLVDYGGAFYTVQQASSGRFLEPYLDEAHDFQAVTRPASGSNLQVWRIVDAQ